MTIKKQHYLLFFDVDSKRVRVCSLEEFDVGSPLRFFLFERDLAGSAASLTRPKAAKVVGFTT